MKVEPAYNHRELCPGAAEKAKVFYENFDIATMEIRSDVSRPFLQDI